ncbi:MAG: immunoglobulin-like domain-containing protein [Lachnospiraceae bacterium]
MRRIRTAVCAVFLISCLVFVLYVVKTKRLEDHVPPVLSCSEDVIYVKSSAGDQELVKGVTAEDDRDGDITDSVRVSAKSHFIEKGKRTVTYIVFDKANQAGTLQRTVCYTDYTSPKIYLSEPLRYSRQSISGVNLTEYMTAEDCIDGDVTKQLRISLSDSFYAGDPGDYDITVQVTNSAGDVRVIPMQVTAVDTADREEAAKFYPMLSEYIVYTEVGKELKLSSYIEGVQRGNTKYLFEADSEYLSFTADEIHIESEVDYTKAGVYPVEYSYSSEEGITAVTRLYVVVEE